MTRPLVVVTKLCLEFAATDLPSLAIALANIGDVLAEGGRLVMMGALEETFYKIGEETFPALRIDRAKMEAAMEEAGMVVEQWREEKRSSRREEKLTGHQGVFSLVARKLTDPLKGYCDN